jgi:hypothetical protein
MPSVGREISDFKAVQAGSTEYTSVVIVEESASSETKDGKLGRNDSLSLVFDDDVILDDITIRNPNGVIFGVSLIYSTGNTIELTPSYTTDFSINKPGDSSNIWYRIPRWSKIKISISPESYDGVMQISAIGRA